MLSFWSPRQVLDIVFSVTFPFSTRIHVHDMLPVSGADTAVFWHVGTQKDVSLDIHQ